jgi:hypothetical protein
VVAACPAEVGLGEVGLGEVALEEVGDDVEFEPHAATIAATSAAAIVTGSSFDLVVFAMMLRLPNRAFTVRSKCLTHARLRKLTYLRLRNCKCAGMKTVRDLNDS